MGLIKMGVLKIGAGVIIGFFGIVFILIMLIGIGASGHDYQVQVVSDGDFTGAIGVNGSVTSYDGSGTQTYDIGDASIVSAAFSHLEDSGTLTVNIIDNGEIVQTGTTSAAYGVVSISD